MRSRYRRWDGTQDPLGDELDAGGLLERIGDDLLRGTGGQAALRRLLRRGVAGQARGLDELRRAAAARRRALEQRVDLDGPLARLRERLREIVDLERQALQARTDEEGAFGLLRLDALPPGPAGVIRELTDHNFASAAAREAFDQLLDDLRRDLLDTWFRQVAGGMRSVQAGDVAAFAAMLAELADMLAARERGDEVDFDGFLDRHGDLFPSRPADLDALLEDLARRFAAASRMLAALSPAQRRELAELARTVLDDADLALEMLRLEQHLRDVLPQLPWDEAVAPGRDGGPPLPMSAAVDTLERIGELEALEEALAGEHPAAALADVDPDLLRRHLGDDAVRDLDRLKRIERALEDAGLLRNDAGELELTPRGARLLGERVLTRLLDRIRRETAVQPTGPDAEPTGQTRPWVFGDREPISVERTVHNAVLRSAAAGRGGGGRLRLDVADFEVTEMEVRPRTATALLLDLSFSMPLRGHFVPAKRMALALHALIEGRHREDSLYLVGFSDYARRLRPADLGASGFERVYGTNMQHAFLLARRLLQRDPRPVRQVIMVTDGEPTAHLDGEHAVFHWPPVEETLVRTLREAMRLARGGIALHVFLLEDDPGLVAFAERLAQLTGGTVVQAGGDELARSIVGGYGRGA